MYWRSGLVMEYPATFADSIVFYCFAAVIKVRDNFGFHLCFTDCVW